MVRIVIIGWYGTETIGDRAILAGIISIIANIYMDFEIKLGSLYPTLSERTILEDYIFLCTSGSKKNISISIFNSSKVAELDSAIKWSDILVMGGGPFMDSIVELYMIDYAFKRAKKKNKKTAILGCGISSLWHSKLIKPALSVISNSDITIFRDNKSLTTYNKFIKKDIFQCVASIDPAIFAADIFNKRHFKAGEKSKIISVNFREILDDTYIGVSTSQMFPILSHLLIRLSEQESTREIHLIPMHTFGIGGDDRYLLNKLSNAIKKKNIHVQNNPLSLEETMKIYSDSFFCIGMRFHSILLQTVLNGKNYIVDYTNPKSGKIVNLLHQLNASGIYKSRYYSLLQPGEQIFDISNDIVCYSVPEFQINSFRKIYLDKLNELHI
ncbi:MAG: polysaccharide pyruvyl transferase family protein [Tannerellaceae bacterium]|jgi:polysaccharide pyruvyl transferase WcaK-like protein|nr:polysaccharide pyruvyl transferase family protein [Tannerellaceae bacterium]